MKSWFVRSILALVLLTGMYLPASAALMPLGDTCTWTGAADDNWHNPANWDCGHVPGPNDAVIVAMGGAPSYIHNPATAGSVTVNPGATLGMYPGRSLTVGAGLTLGQNTELMLGSDSTITLQYGDWTDNGAFIPGADPWALILGGQGNQAITGAKPTQSFRNLTLRNTGMMVLPLVNCGPHVQQVNIGGTLTLDPDIGLNTGSASVQVGGDWFNNGGTYQGSGGVTFVGGNDQRIGGTAASQTFPDDLTLDKTGGNVTLGGSTTQLNVNGALNVYGGTLNLGSGTLTTRGPATIRQTGTLNLGIGTWNSGACIYLQTGGTLTPGSGTLNFQGGTFGLFGGILGLGSWTANFNMPWSQTIIGFGASSFHNVGVYNATMGGPMPVLRVGDSRGGGPSEFNLTGSFTIGEGATFDPGSLSALYVTGPSWENNGTVLPGQGTTTFRGSAPRWALGLAAAQVITGAAPTTFNNLTIDNPDGVMLGSSQRVSGTLNLKSGDLTTGAYTLTLGSAATVTGTRDVVGTVQRTHVFTPGIPFSFNHRFASLTFADPGTLTSVAMTMLKTLPVGLTPAVARTYTITPVGGGYTATLRLPYRDTELNGIPEGDLRLWQREGTRWVMHYPQVGHALENWIEQIGITEFSTWTLASLNATSGWRIFLPLIQRP